MAAVAATGRDSSDVRAGVLLSTELLLSSDQRACVTMAYRFLTAESAGPFSERNLGVRRQRNSPPIFPSADTMQGSRQLV
jgi:hypothetical protein